MSQAEEQSTGAGIKWWWVNQGGTYQKERAGGFIWAPQKTKSGLIAFHHANVFEVKQGDVVFCYSKGLLKAIGIAKRDAVKAEKPETITSDAWHEEGFLAEIDYLELPTPIKLDEIPLEWRKSASAAGKSPFTQYGAICQGYLYRLDANFIDRVAGRFKDRLPSELFPKLKDLQKTELPENLEAFIQATKSLKVNVDNGKPKLYKPALLLAVLNLLDQNSDHQNLFSFQEVLPVFQNTTAAHGFASDSKQLANAFYHLKSSSFWRLQLKDGASMPTAGEPAQLERTVTGAYFDEPFWVVLQSQNARQRLREEIANYWFATDVATEQGVDFERAQAIENVISAIAAAGYHYQPWQIAAYITALRTKPFLILAGISGSGKTQLPLLVASATGSTKEVITVRPDWTDSTDILGYVNLQNRFMPGQLLTLARAAQEDASVHCLAVIDEMNLARVEHYFAEILSQLELSRGEGNDGAGMVTLSLSDEDLGWGKVGLKSNMALVGTVNMDESTHGFSKKVLDRAFTIEFSEINLKQWETTAAADVESKVWPSYAWQPRARRLSELEEYSSEERDLINQTIDELIKINTILTQAQLQIAYRSRDEIVLFVLHANENLACFREETAEGNRTVNPMDLAIQMKLLPRISGGGSFIKTVLEQLLLLCAGDSDDGDASAYLERWRESRSYSLDGAKYGRTCARLCLMLERYERDGYTSYWL